MKNMEINQQEEKAEGNKKRKYGNAITKNRCYLALIYKQIVYPSQLTGRDYSTC